MGIVVEHIPWSDGKRPVTYAMMGFLARWGTPAELAGNGARLPDQLGSGLSVGGMVCRVGLAAPPYCAAVESIGVDEIHWGRGLKADNFLTVIYQIDVGGRRFAVGGTPAFAGHAAAGPEGAGGRR